MELAHMIMPDLLRTHPFIVTLQHTVILRRPLNSHLNHGEASMQEQHTYLQNYMMSCGYSAGATVKQS